MERLTALVVDDEPSVCRLLEVVLGAEFDVTVRHDGLAAAEYLKTNTPSIIILDVNMPKVGGLELCAKIKRMSRFAHTPVIILTASNDERIEDSAKMSKADVFAHKPLQGKNFLELARRLVAGEQEKVMQLLKMTRF